MEMDVSPIVKREQEEEYNIDNNDEEEEEQLLSSTTFFLAAETEIHENEESTMYDDGQDEKLKSTIFYDEELLVKGIVKDEKPIDMTVFTTDIFENENDDDDEEDDMYDEYEIDDPLIESDKNVVSELEDSNSAVSGANENLTGTTNTKEDGAEKTLQFECEFCPGIIFPCSKAFTQHRKKQHPDSQRVVEVEPNKFLYDDTWGIFLSTNGPDKIFTCGTCFATQKSLPKICRHIDYLHKNVTRPRRSQLLTSHANIQVLSNGSTICPECGRTYCNRQTLYSHLRLHNRERTIICPAPNCGKRFHYKSNLTFHMRVHSSEKQNKCSVCQKTFSIKGDLKEHELTHLIQDPRPWKCPIEGSSFAWKKGLLEHIKRYHPPSGEMEKFECPFENCDKTFVSKSNYNKHLLSHEQPNQIQMCDICNAKGKKVSFKTSAGFERHQRKMHNPDNPDTLNKNNKRIGKEENETRKQIKKKKKSEDEVVLSNKNKEVDIEITKVDVDAIFEKV